ncbi:MAG: VOC family protein, partial [Proteobacteria bacterium]|nr:VOC family protein [Pseudomonadota bacterium]
MLSQIDHLVFATPDLDQGTSYIEELLGVDAVAGGTHPDFGTHNSLVSLGHHTYLEIVAPDPHRTDPSIPGLFRLHEI